MDDVFKLPQRDPPSVPLKGYVVKEQDGSIWLQDYQSTWIVSANDLVGRSSWTGVDDSRFGGEPSILYIRDGADITEVRTVKARSIVNWPLPIAQATRAADVKGAADVDGLARARFAEIKAAADYECVPTYSMAADKTGWGIVCHRDDWTLV